MKATYVVIAWLLTFALVNGQEKSKVGDFTRSATEHMTVELDQPFVVRSVKGMVSRSQGDMGPLADVLIEIRGPDNVLAIKRATTNERGQFKIGHAAPGTYRFKTTLDGFQSVMGTIIVSKKANKDANIRIEVPVGV